MTMTKKILSLILALIICVTSVPFAFATDADIDIEGTTLFEETTTEEVTEPDEETTPPDEEVTVPDTDTTEPEVPDEDITVPDEDVTEPDEEPVIPDEEPEEEPTEPDDTDEPDIKPEESKPLQDNDIVATLYVFYDKSDIHGMGHTWIYIENLTNQELKVGIYPLPAYEGVSVGTLPEYDGWGIYYNIEAYQQTIYGMEGQVSMKEEITLKKLRRVSNYIVNYPNIWDPVIFNCMLFAFFAWDTGSLKILLPLIFPIIGKLQMMIYPHEMEVQMMPVTIDKVYRQTGMAGWAKLVPYTP